MIVKTNHSSRPVASPASGAASSTSAAPTSAAATATARGDAAGNLARAGRLRMKVSRMLAWISTPGMLPSAA